MASTTTLTELHDGSTEVFRTSTGAPMSARRFDAVFSRARTCLDWTDRTPPRVIREALANAVAHRSYEHTGSAIRVDIYTTHLTVTSPGGLPEPVTLGNLRFQQSARNDRLLGALRRLGLAEDLGKGIDRMEDDMADELLRPPEFADDGSFFSVTLRLGGAVTTHERAWVRSLVQEGRLDGRTAMVVVGVAREGSITNGKVRSMLNVDSVEARALLQSLIAVGVLVRRGERGGADYHLAPDLGVPARIRHTDAELEQVVGAVRVAEPSSVVDRQILDEIFRRRSGNAAHPSDHPQRQPPLTRSSETTNSSAE